MKRLTLKMDRLADLTEDELRLAGGAAFDDTYTGQVGCVLSIKQPCVTNQFCTLFCKIEG